MGILEAQENSLNHFLRYEGGVLDANKTFPFIICGRRGTSRICYFIVWGSRGAFYRYKGSQNRQKLNTVIKMYRMAGILRELRVIRNMMLEAINELWPAGSEQYRSKSKEPAAIEWGEVSGKKRVSRSEYRGTIRELRSAISGRREATPRSKRWDVICELGTNEQLTVRAARYEKNKQAARSKKQTAKNERPVNDS